MTTFTSEDRDAAYQKKVEEAPYHPGYEDAVVTRRSDPVYRGMDPAKMIWKPKPLNDEEIKDIFLNNFPKTDHEELRASYIFILKHCIRDAEERYGIK